MTTDAGALAATYFRAWKEHDFGTLRSILAAKRDRAQRGHVRVQSRGGLTRAGPGDVDGPARRRDLVPLPVQPERERAVCRRGRVEQALERQQQRGRAQFVAGGERLLAAPARGAGGLPARRWARAAVTQRVLTVTLVVPVTPGPSGALVPSGMALSGTALSGTALSGTALSGTALSGTAGRQRAG